MANANTIVPSVPKSDAATQRPSISPDVNGYDHIVDMIRRLDLHDDGIQMNQKIKCIESNFCNIIKNEEMLRDSMRYINDKALEDSDTSMKFGLLFSWRNGGSLTVNDKDIRTAMIEILELNYKNADAFRLHNKDRLHNSIALLGEYYHRVRLAGNAPIEILGKSLMDLLLREISDFEAVDIHVAKLLLTQITLNGNTIRVDHKEELDQLLFNIRVILIEQPQLKSDVKAVLLMTLDLHYRNFGSLGEQLQSLYVKYLVQGDDDKGNMNNNNNNNNNNSNSNNNNNTNTITATSPTIAAVTINTNNNNNDNNDNDNTIINNDVIEEVQASSPPLQAEQEAPAVVNANEENAIERVSVVDGSSTTLSDNDDDLEYMMNARKWTEQLNDDSTCDEELEKDESYDSGGGGGRDSNNRNVNGFTVARRGNSYSSNHSDDCDSNMTADTKCRRSYNQQPEIPRPLRQHAINPVDGGQHRHRSEERNKSENMPSWRAMSRGDQTQGNTNARGSGTNTRNRRYSSSFDDDQESVRSEGGSIRLYSVRDRLRHSQGRMNRNQDYGHWDHQQAPRDDHSERSYGGGNYDRTNHYRRGGVLRNYGARQTYDKPPRFQKKQQQSQQPQRQAVERNESWRRVTDHHHHPMQSHHDEMVASHPPYEHEYVHEQQEHGYQDASHAHTLPRPGKWNCNGKMDGYQRGWSKSPTPGNDGAWRENPENHQHSVERRSSQHQYGRRHNGHRRNYK